MNVENGEHQVQDIVGRHEDIGRIVADTDASKARMK